MKNNNFNSQGFIKVRTKGQHKILASSLLWFSFGLFVVFGLAFLLTNVTAIKNFYLNNAFNNSAAVVVIVVISIALPYIINYGAFRFKIETLAILYVLYCTYFAFLMSFVFLEYADQFTDLLLIIGITIGIFIFMSLLGYFQVVNFGKLAPLLIFASIAMFGIAIATWFVYSSILITIMSVFGVILFSGYIGFDMWKISRTEEMYDASNSLEKSDITRFGLIFGMRLLVDFVMIVYYLSRIMRYAK
ncbi:MAG: Bax inhibitor-1 family protein [Mycoplasma sp.]|nr:Bax inhibitor-1 family protein [Mycoplasma sp.]